MLKLKELKETVRECWLDLSQFNRAIAQSENFKPEVRKFGDLRRKETWIAAYCNFWAKNIMDSNSDNRTLVLHMLNFSPEQWDYELRDRILDEFLKHPEAMECIANGLEQIFGQPTTTQETDTAYGVFELVQAKSRGGIRATLPARTT